MESERPPEIAGAWEEGESCETTRLLEEEASEDTSLVSSKATLSLAVSSEHTESAKAPEDGPEGSRMECESVDSLSSVQRARESSNAIVGPPSSADSDTTLEAMEGRSVVSSQEEFFDAVLAAASTDTESAKSDKAKESMPSIGSSESCETLYQSAAGSYEDDTSSMDVEGNSAASLEQDLGEKEVW